MPDMMDVLNAWGRTGSIRATADSVGLSTQTVRRVLLDEGIDCSPYAYAIRARLNNGESAETIAKEFGIKEKTVETYRPYSRGSYAVGERTMNAQRIAEWRRRRATAK